MEPIIIESRISKNLAENQQYFDEKLRVGMNYDMLTSKLQIAGKSAVLYYINGMYKDELMQKVLQYLFSVKGEEMPQSASEFLQNNIPCTEVELEDRKEKILINILAGQIALLVDVLFLMQGSFRQEAWRNRLRIKHCAALKMVL